MTKNRANPQRSYLPGSTSYPESDTESDTEAECPEMSENVRRIENSNLSQRQQAARYAMSFAVRVWETEKFKKDVQYLEDAVALSNAQ